MLSRELLFFDIFIMTNLFFVLYYRHQYMSKEEAHMEDKALLTEAYQLVSELNQAIQSCKQGLPDDLRLQQNIDEILRALKKAEKVDNAILIELETFYQRTSLLIGLGSLKLNDQARTAWRNYDKFHFDHVKHTLTLYGPVFGL